MDLHAATNHMTVWVMRTLILPTTAPHDVDREPATGESPAPRRAVKLIDIRAS